MTPDELLAFRQTLGLTQRGLAGRLGVPQSTIWRWESGTSKVDHPTILRLALGRLVDLAAR